MSEITKFGNSLIRFVKFDPTHIGGNGLTYITAGLIDRFRG